MALIDRARDVYFDRARERWKQKGFDADITDILEDYRAETNKKIKRDKVNVLSTFLISLYDYDHDSLQLDITKLIVLSPSSEFPAKDIMYVRHNSDGEFTSIKEDDIPIIESHLIPLMPDKMIDYEEAE